MDAQNTANTVADQNVINPSSDIGTNGQAENLNASNQTTTPVILASNEAKTDTQPQIASETNINPETIGLSKTAPAVVEGEVTQQPVENQSIKPLEGQIVENKPKHPGQPTKFNEGVIKKAKDYLAFSLKNKNLPLIEELARICEVDSDTINNWTDKNEEFFGAIKRIKELQKERIILKGFSAKNPTFSIFMLKANHGMMETEKQVLIADRDMKVSITRE